MQTVTDRTTPALAQAERFTAHNYHPLPIVIADADGAWVTDVDGRRYLDCLAGYSALNFGHRHPVLLDAARKQLEHVTLTSRAFLHDQFGPFCQAVAGLCGMEMVLPMNTGAEAVETRSRWPGSGATRSRECRTIRRPLWSLPETSTAVRRPSSASPPIPTRGPISVRTRQDSGWCPTATSTPCGPPSTTPRWPC